MRPFPAVPALDDSIIVSRTLLADTMMALSGCIRRLDTHAPHGKRGVVDSAVHAHGQRCLIQGSAALRLAQPTLDRVDREIVTTDALVRILRPRAGDVFPACSLSWRRTPGEGPARLKHQQLPIDRLTARPSAHRLSRHFHPYRGRGCFRKCALRSRTMSASGYPVVQHDHASIDAPEVFRLRFRSDVGIVVRVGPHRLLLPSSAARHAA